MFKSNADWGDPRGLTTDTHETKKGANAVCNRLKKEGWAGGQKSYPIRTWVEEIPDSEHPILGLTLKVTCEWRKTFDGHYSIDCVDKHGLRANGNFKAYPWDNLGNQPQTKWEFTYCPYCGKKIVVIKMEK